MAEITGNRDEFYATLGCLNGGLPELDGCTLSVLNDKSDIPLHKYTINGNSASSGGNNYSVEELIEKLEDGQRWKIDI